jgi:hypothetical protein
VFCWPCVQAIATMASACGIKIIRSAQ